MDDEVIRAGRDVLADELCDLRCDLGLAELGERSYAPDQHARMRIRRDELEELVGDHLDALLAAEDEADAAFSVSRERQRSADGEVRGDPDADLPT